MIVSDTDMVGNALASTGAGAWVWDSGQPETLQVQWTNDQSLQDLRGDISDESWHMLASRLHQALLDPQSFQTTVTLGSADGLQRELQVLGARSAQRIPSTRITGLCWLAGYKLRSDAQAQWVPLAKLSHELRSPLAAVAQKMRELGDEVEDASMREQLESAHESSVYMLRIVEDMLTAFRAGEPGAVRQPEWLSTERLIGQLMPIAANHARRKGLQLRVQRETEFPGHFLAESVALRRILQNLLDNAIKYTVQGEITVVLGVAIKSDGAWLQFDVQDTGAGMSAEDIARVFEPFARGRAGRATAAGLGIGLALSRQLAISLDGDLTVHSEPGRGSRFRLTIPARIPADEVPAGEPSPEDVAMPIVMPGTKVLLVDDHPLLSKLTGRALSKLGCEVDVAASAHDAISMVEQRVPDLVILDLDLPDMTGCELCRQLMDREQLSQCRFVAYSGSDEMADREAAAQAGFHAFFVKPASAEELLSA